jgi:hypothetical protein
MAFYAGADGLSGPDVLRSARELLTSSESHGEYYIDGGEFLPLSVWVQRGYDSNRIHDLTKPADIREDRVLGTTYRVRILATGNKGEGMVTRTSQHKRKSGTPPVALEGQSSSSSRPRTLALEDKPEPQASASATPPADDSGTSSSSSRSDSSNSSNSSSSSSGKHKKDKKGNKKSKKDKKNKKNKKGKKNKKDKKDKKGKREKKNKKDEHRGT